MREADGLELGGARARAPRGRVLEESGGHGRVIPRGWARLLRAGWVSELGRPNLRSALCPRFFLSL